MGERGHEELKIHLGCGEKFLPGWTHVDARPGPHVDYVADVLDLPFDDDSAEMIYWCHGIEHIPFALVQPALAEWRRVLQPGGILRLSTPDFNLLSAMYSQTKVELRLIRYAIMGGQDYEENFHYSLWDFASLSAELQRAGYVNVRRYDAKAVVPAGFDWSVMRIANQWISLNVEAEAQK